MGFYISCPCKRIDIDFVVTIVENELVMRRYEIFHTMTIKHAPSQ